MERHTKRIGGEIELTHGIQKAVLKLANYEDLEEKCIEETTFGFATLLRKWKEFQDDIAQFVEWRELAKSGRLVVLPEVFDEKKLFRVLSYSACPNVFNLPRSEKCPVIPCKDCWENALKIKG